MSIIIDGYNLLNIANVVVETGGQHSLEKSRDAVLRLVRYLVPDQSHRRTTVVFDAKHAPPGLPNRFQFGNLSVRFADRGKEADDLIEQLILEESAPRQLVVVSSDHRLQRAARRRRARGVDSDVWVREMQQAILNSADRSSSHSSDRSSDSNRSAKPQGVDRPQPTLADEEVAEWLSEFGPIDVTELLPFDDVGLRDHGANGDLEAASTGDQTDEGLNGEQKDDFDEFNPFPEGYGEDLLDEDS